MARTGSEPRRSAKPLPKTTRATSRKSTKRPSLNPRDLIRLNILSRVRAESVWGLLEGAPVQVLAKGDVLIEKGIANAVMHVVLDGRLSVNLESPTLKPVAFVESGQTVGELSVIDHRPTSAFVIAAEPSRILTINEETYWRLIAASHQFAKNMFLLLTQRLRASNFTIAENIRLRKLLEHDVSVDSLTGLRNRKWLDENLPRLVQRYRRTARPLSIGMVDVDHFKQFNDTFGHSAGDRVLTLVGQTITARMRPTDFAARYGGEEFVLILPDTEIAGAAAAAERLRDEIALMTAETADGHALPPITISLGLAQMGKRENGPHLLGRADQALYRAKHNGRNRTELAWPRIRTTMQMGTRNGETAAAKQYASPKSLAP